MRRKKLVGLKNLFGQKKLGPKNSDKKISGQINFVTKTFVGPTFFGLKYLFCLKKIVHSKFFFADPTNLVDALKHKYPFQKIWLCLQLYGSKLLLMQAKLSRKTFKLFCFKTFSYSTWPKGKAIIKPMKVIFLGLNFFSLWH